MLPWMLPWTLHATSLLACFVVLRDVFHLFVFTKVCVATTCTYVSPRWWQWLQQFDHCLRTSAIYTAIIGCHSCTKILHTEMTQTHIPFVIKKILQKTQEWNDCQVHRNLGLGEVMPNTKQGWKSLSKAPGNITFTHSQSHRHESAVGLFESSKQRYKKAVRLSVVQMPLYQAAVSHQMPLYQSVV